MSPDRGRADHESRVSVLEGNGPLDGLGIRAGARVHLDLSDDGLARDVSGHLQAERMTPLWPAGEYEVCPGDILISCLETPAEQCMPSVLSSTDQLRLIALTPDDSDESVLGALALGAWAIVERRSVRHELADAVWQVAAGQAPVLGMAMKHERVACRLLDAARALLGQCPDEGTEKPVNPLNARELQMLRLAAQGVTNGQIASRLQLSEQTVKNYMSAIFDKLGVRRRAHATVHAQRNGWI